jgi:AraC-like DNA-binding protein
MQMCIIAVGNHQRHTDFNQRATDFMNISITSTTHEPFDLQLNYPREFSGLQQLEERQLQKDAPWGNLKINELWFDGACVFQSVIKANDGCRLRMQCDNSCWLMNFVLDGELITAVEEPASVINLKAGQYNCMYCTNLNIQAGVEQTTRLFTVCLTRRFIKHLFWKSAVLNNGDLDSADKTIFVTSIQPITGRLKEVISEIIAAGQPSYIRRIYLEGKILELLSLQLKDNLLQPARQPASDVNADDLQKLHIAKRMIEEDIKTPCSLFELARRTGLNDFKLKKGFKAAFGYTVFGYIAELRMTKAYTLLQQNCSVSEAAESVGYKNAHHFTAAFKKRFGILPSAVVAGH